MDNNSPQRSDLDRLAQKARDTLVRSSNCAQTSFSVLQEECDLEGGPILRALTPFPGIASAVQIAAEIIQGKE